MRHQSRHFRRLCYRRWFGIRWATYCTPAAGGDLWNPEEYLLADRHVLGAARERHYSILHVIHQLFFLSRLLCLTIVVYFGIRSKGTFGINPDHGSKAEKKSKEREPKNIQFDEKIMDSEWNVYEASEKWNWRVF
ncbi:uncharacterized protein LOC119372589 isoform X2 [Rhipicephalus sanguineus]|uniref:uncharacterized protein LOC119372589 isoform X2 n=1 Tax=Rhipicephalus sanguineus TaxID=34632 RepID=UPI0020C5380D|nr:uncharacterized protein LOC119372589 isoform X2 [Rhipicephalus sanguineus]